jgi:TPP-dependent pyruvate/acetoin dehydrogenase alpha subunit
VLLAEEQIISNKWAKRSETASWRQEAEAEVNSTVDKVRREPGPTPEEDDWMAYSKPEFAQQYAGA